MENIIHFINSFNDVFGVPIENIKRLTSLNFDSFPKIINHPIIFALLSTFIFFFVIFSFVDIVYMLIAVVYPILANNTINNSVDDEETKAHKIIAIYHYWMLFGLITCVDTIFGPYLWYVPFYRYAKILLAYVLVRDNFNLSYTIYAVLHSLIETLHINDHISDLENLIISKYANKISTKMVQKKKSS